MSTKSVKGLLLASLLLVIGGLATLVLEAVGLGSEVNRPVPSGVTLLLVGVLIGAVGQVLLGQNARIEALERRLSERSEHP
jgi:hypothetical protein